MYNIGIIMGGVMPVPAVCGGAIETLIESIVKQYSGKAQVQPDCSISAPISGIRSNRQS